MLGIVRTSSHAYALKKSGFSWGTAEISVANGRSAAETTVLPGNPAMPSAKRKPR